MPHDLEQRDRPPAETEGGGIGADACGSSRLVLIGDWPPPPGGVAIHLQTLRDAARKAGAEVRVLDIGKGGNEAEDIVPAGTPPRFAAALAHACSFGNLVHLHTSGANPKSWLLIAAVGFAARTAGLRSVVTFHSGHGPKYLSTPARAFFARFSLSPYDRVVCVNREISLALSRIGAATGRHVLAPAFGREGLVPGDLPQTLVAPLREGRQLVTAMLAPGRDYGEAELLDAFATIHSRHPSTTLVLYGPGTDSLQTRTAIHRSGAGPVITLGAIERQRALALLQASTLFVRPTRVDGDAVSVREALALGTPVVATRVGHRPEGVLLCDAGDAAALADAMDHALRRDSPSVSSPFGEPGQHQRRRQRHEGRYEHHEQDGIDTILNVYAQLVRGPAVRRRIAA